MDNLIKIDLEEAYKQQEESLPTPYVVYTQDTNKVWYRKDRIVAQFKYEITQAYLDVLNEAKRPIVYFSIPPYLTSDIAYPVNIKKVVIDGVDCTKDVEDFELQGFSFNLKIVKIKNPKVGDVHQVYLELEPFESLKIPEDSVNQMCEMYLYFAPFSLSSPVSETLLNDQLINSFIISGDQDSKQYISLLFGIGLNTKKLIFDCSKNYLTQIMSILYSKIFTDFVKNSVTVIFKNYKPEIYGTKGDGSNLEVSIDSEFNSIQFTPQKINLYELFEVIQKAHNLNPDVVQCDITIIEN